MSLSSFLQLITAISVVGGFFALVFATWRTKLPESTIKIQNDSIAALRTQSELHEQKLQTLTQENIELRRQVNVLRDLPLQQIAKNNRMMAEGIKNLLDKIEGGHLKFHHTPDNGESKK